MRILLIRAVPDAQKTAMRLQESGHRPVLMPLVARKDLLPDIPDRRFDGLILTSANAVAGLRIADRAPQLVHVPVWCVGKQTGEAAIAAGLTLAEEPAQDARSLDAALAERAKGQKLLYAAAVDRAHEFGEDADPGGVQVTTVEVYKMQPLYRDARETAAKLELVRGGGVMVYSARSGELLAQAMQAADPGDDIAATMTLYAISERASMPLRHLRWQEVAVSRTPDEDALFSLIGAAN